MHWCRLQTGETTGQRRNGQPFLHGLSDLLTQSLAPDITDSLLNEEQVGDLCPLCRRQSPTPCCSQCRERTLSPGGNVPTRSP